MIAWFDIKSIIPLNSDSEPTGICIGTALAFNLSLTVLTHLKKSAPVASILFT